MSDLKEQANAPPITNLVNPVVFDALRFSPLAPDLEALIRRVVPDSRCTNPPPRFPLSSFSGPSSRSMDYESCAASKRPGCSPIRPILKLANIWQIRF